MALACGVMPSVQIKAVPEDVHRVLRTRAAAAGQSLQEYLLALLVDEARHESLDAWLDRVGSHSGGSLSLEEAVEVQHELRRGG
jgi:plasmid stability protein